ncbi:MAG TPA: antibiotic biosynthesis monooxygenase [Methanobacteriaceae archaeon]|nr:antibiotic biosynthesis monooxygenase [Methanobacteriaceae archaeon]
MEIITTIKGKIQPSKVDKFKEGYEKLKTLTLPEGMKSFYLLQDGNDPDAYIIVASMENEEALQKMQRSKATPVFDLFMNMEAEPVPKVFKVMDHHVIR